MGSVIHAYHFDPVKLQHTKNRRPLLIKGEPKVIQLDNGEAEINNLKLIKCDGREFICTVDMQANVRMIFLSNLDRELIKFSNVYEGIQDNSTWSLCGSPTNPPRVVVGSNSHKVSVFNLNNPGKRI